MKKMPKGWTEIPGGMMTNTDPKVGGIIDKNLQFNNWFAGPTLVMECFKTRDQAYKASNKR